VRYPPQLQADYYPSSLTHDDYPDVIPAGQSVDTIADGTVLIAYNWSKTNVDRYRRVQRFVEAFFPKIAEFQKPPRHPKWREVNLAASLPGWTRFDAAQAWLDNRPEASTEEPSAGVRQTVQLDGPNASPQKDTALYQEFLQWKKMRQGR
jgi:hypothetical protein